MNLNRLERLEVEYIRMRKSNEKKNLRSRNKKEKIRKARGNQFQIKPLVGFATIAVPTLLPIYPTTYWLQHSIAKTPRDIRVRDVYVFLVPSVYDAMCEDQTSLLDGTWETSKTINPPEIK